ELGTQNPSEFFKTKLAESAQRHARTGDSVYLLQPHLKDGPGGLRDLHTALWMAKVKFKVHGLRDLVPLGVTPERDMDALQRALALLWRPRNAVPSATGAHHDQLRFDLQERIAPTMDFPPGKEGVEAFMRAYYGHATTVSRVSDAVIARCVLTPEP